ncbi:MAG: carbon monoxide dehydrogenase, partial [Thermodesulfovibrionales bacterium]
MDKEVKKEVKMRSANPEAEKIVEWGAEHKIETCFERAEKMKPCPIGAPGSCCKVCHMGPCRFVGKNAEEEMRGVCGATLPTVATRNLVRMIAAGTSAHSDHARGMAYTLLAVANGEAKDFKITDVRKLYRVAGYLDVEFEGRQVNDVARDVATKLIEDFGRQGGGELWYVKRAPKKTQERWRKWGIVPRSIDREVVEAMHRTNIGVDHDPDHLLLQGLRTSLADG